MDFASNPFPEGKWPYQSKVFFSPKKFFLLMASVNYLLSINKVNHYLLYIVLLAVNDSKLFDWYRLYVSSLQQADLYSLSGCGCSMSSFIYDGSFTDFPKCDVYISDCISAAH